jgi:serine/threonine protein kinase
MGVVFIALDRSRATMLTQVDEILRKATSIDPESMKTENGSIEFSQKDKVRITIYLTLGILEQARKLRNESMVAIKVMRPEFSGAKSLNAFRHEARLWLEIAGHPNVIQLKEVIRLSNELGLVLEYVDGGTLRDVLEQSEKLGIDKTLEIAVEICDGMEHLHSTLEILHRDLKPSNVLLSLDGTPKITDFGLAKAKKGVEFPGAVIAGGTLGYMSPEQMKNPEMIDRRSDIYSFGVMLYEMVTGNRPIKRSSQWTFPDKGIPKDLQLIILRCLEENPAKRFGSFDEIKANLLAVAKEQGFLFPLPPIPDVPLEAGLISWANHMVREIASFPSRNVAFHAAQSSGPIVEHSMLGVGQEDGDNDRYDSGQAQDLEQGFLNRHDHWIMRFATESTNIDWKKMCSTHQDLRDRLSKSLSSDGVSFYRWYQKGMGLLALGCYGEALACFDHIISPSADDGRTWDVRGRTEYGPACLGKGLALLELGRKSEAEEILSKAMEACFYPLGFRGSYIGQVPGRIQLDERDVLEYGTKGSQISVVRCAKELSMM